MSSCVSSQTDDSNIIEKEIRRTMRKQKLPAMAVTVVRGQEVLYQETHGQIDLERQIPATNKSVFKLWSMAKAFTALEIFREIEEGLVDPDAPLTTYLPDFSIRDSYNDRDTITIRDVLAHRAGLPRHEGLLPEGEARVDLYYIERFELGAANCYTAYPVATRYKYSNLGYDLLGRVIEETRGAGFFYQMKKHVLNELGMQHADFYSGAIDSSLHRALGYEYHKRDYYPYVQYDINNFPSGNLYATIEDLSAFLLSMFRQDFFRKNETLSGMLVDHYSHPGDPETMGLGWKLAPLENGDTLVWHDGGPSEGIGSLVAFLPEQQLGIAVIGNATSFSGFYSIQFALKILNHFMHKGPGNEQQHEQQEQDQHQQHQRKPAHKLTTEAMNELEGSYAAFGTLAKVKRKGKKLKVELGDISLRLVPLSSTEFAVTHWMERLGLNRIIKAPVDFKKLGVDFMKDPSYGSESMIIHMLDVSHEICPRYPEQEVIPEEWKHLCGSYRRADRIAGGTWGELSEGLVEIRIEEGVLSMSGAYGPILPAGDNMLRVLSGSFHGEYLDYLPGSGVILHQKWAFVPVGR
jgi:CubicO group peptidase (beta-lactamase class C family)